MHSSPRLPTWFPLGTKYVLESHGLFVRRHIEFPDGRRVQLATRKALTCIPCSPVGWQKVSFIPDQNIATLDVPSKSKKPDRASPISH
jgi:hypothetical protein